MFLNNKYTHWYYALMRKSVNRKLTCYVEQHHIIPRCMGGTDLSENLVKLTAREHFIAHLLLTKMTEGLNRRKMSYALSFMLTSCRKLNNRHLPNSKWFEYSRILLSETQKGRIFSDTTKNRMRSSAIERFKNPEARNRVSTWTKNPSISTRNKIGHAAKNRSDASLAKMRSVKNKPCTIDGIVIFESRKLMAEKLGWSKNGVASPNFRYL